jgi:hypothetical protein
MWKLKVKQSHYRPGQALRVPGIWGSYTLKQSVHEGGKVITPTYRLPLPRNYSWYSFLLPGVKVASAYGWQPYHLHVPIVLKSGSINLLESSGPLQACNGIALPSPFTHFCQRLSQPQGHSAARRIMSMKNSSNTIGNRTRDLQACSTVPQPTAPPRAPVKVVHSTYIRNIYVVNLYSDLCNQFS